MKGLVLLAAVVVMGGWGFAQAAAAGGGGAAAAGEGAAANVGGSGEVIAAGGAAAGGTAGPSVFQHFVTRAGDRLMDGDKQWRAIGANMPGLVVPYDFTLRLPERMGLAAPWEQEDGLKTCVQMNLRVIRTWNLPMRGPDEPEQPWHYVLAPGRFNEEAFKTIDVLLALANRHGVRVILALSADAGGYLGGVQTYAAWRKKTKAQFWTDPECKEDYKATLRYVVNRRNTVTGRAYKDDKAILCWEFGNELRSGPDAWQSEMAAYLKGLDPNHLIMDAYDARVPAEQDPNIDINNRHYYGGDWLKNLKSDLARSKGKRPFMVGEFGLSSDVPMVARFLEAVNAGGAAGALIWSMYFHNQSGGFYWHQIFTHPSLSSYHWPGFPNGEAHKEAGILAALREGAFKIQGLPVPPVPAPEPPVLLPVGDVPLITWRGSAGASGYDVERAAGAAGPWARAAGNVCDADTAYRPLFSDTGVRAGDTVYYRVIARNASGASAPSNVVGPVRVKGVCFVDELKDLSLAAEKSDGLTLANDHNALYMEYLYRAKGDAGQWLVYKTTVAMTAFKVVAFFAEKGQDLGLQVSADGKIFSDLKAERTERNPRSSAGDIQGASRWMVEYQGPVPAGHTSFKVLWNGPGELDRVELYYPGAAVQENRRAKTQVAL